MSEPMPEPMSEPMPDVPVWVHRFDQLDEVERQGNGDWDSVRALLGGKGSGLAEMTRLGIPVPPGFTVTTRACLRYLENDNTMPDGLWDQVVTALHDVEDRVGKRFGDPASPLLVSCRSGAKFSMPGMMDTVLNIGLNDDTAKGLIALTGDEHFVYDSYRRLIQMFGTVVLGLRDDLFENILSRARTARGVSSDSDLTVDDLRAVITGFRDIAGQFPTDPQEQLRMAIEAVFSSWNGKRAVDYRNAAGIPHDLGTAVNIQAMVFGNLGDRSATGVCMTRSGATGQPGLEGDFLINAQGEDVVSGTRATRPIESLSQVLPEAYAELQATAAKLEARYRDMQDIEFTVEDGRLWMLQTRDGKRTAQAAVRIAVDLATEGLITRPEALLRVTPAQIDFFLHPQLTPADRKRAADQGRLVARGLDVSPGAAVGIAAFDPNVAQRLAADGRKVILVRPETKPDDVHGMLAAEGILTTRGGRTSHAALVARQFGKPAVVGVGALDVDVVTHRATVGELVIGEGDWLSIDGSTGEVYLGQLQTFVPDITDPRLATLLTWADDHRQLGVRANADYPADARRARDYGAEGVGLCRTEHMFFQSERLPVMQRMIMSDSITERRDALAELEPLQRADFLGLFQAMDGLPVIIRLVDPPLHEFLPTFEQLSERITDAKIRLSAAGSLDEVDNLLSRLRNDEDLLRRVRALHEANPMLGLRGVRLAIRHPEILQMQTRAIFEAACDAMDSGCKPMPEVMVPLTTDPGELVRVRKIIESEAEAVFADRQVRLPYQIGTMIETPRATLLAARLAEHADFFSVGSNDLTQMTYGLSRDDAETSFLLDYLRSGVLDHDPFSSLDPDGVGALIDLAVDAASKTQRPFEVGVCGEHGGDPASITWCHQHGLSYVSCSPFRVPVARLAAAQAALVGRADERTTNRSDT
ncbi:pyruvate, phosphate dikinase [Microlunatus sp. Gsoil 973]|uniref:pyruvate, phosphate dikinase n=1 Tax=Microlunatus sp. Gsoil 973 TaxID=2672569 RepID=UPI0012B4498A|nr:pyruvate, phosphate dikinase [Microlunatus sp. Gsoil 973]QGN33935.1 pyruvate, phosphate dikinase [Microlunatus sp. Gsoil 973]